MKKLSVIVPVYNVENYLDKCISSIISQTYKNLEIILVNDGSNDNSLNICNNYSKLDQRIIVIDQKNQGVSAARNAGMNIATGYYLAFVDSDDYIDKNMYKDLIECLEKHDLDIICCSGYRVIGSKVLGNPGSDTLTIYQRDEILQKSLLDYQNSPWNKVYKSSITKNVRFPVGQLFEDTATAYLFYENTTRVGVLDHAYYYYVKNMNSITQTSFKVKPRYDFVIGYQDRLNYAIKHNLSCIPECRSLLVKAALSCLTAIYATNDYSDIYYKIDKILQKNKCEDAYLLLNFKYKVYLYCYGKLNFIHKAGAKLSFISKKLKSKLKM